MYEYIYKYRTVILEHDGTTVELESITKVKKEIIN